MKQTLKLSSSLTLPIDAVTEKLAWLGRTGSGKTYGAMKLAELMLDAGAQIGVIDPVGVWRALRVPAQKGGAAFHVYVFGGLYGDLPLHPTTEAGKLVADLVCDNPISFVLDVSQWVPHEQQRFVRAFGDQFFHRRKSAPAAVHLFVEECQEFMPQNPQGDEAMTLHVFQRLWKIGRNFGIGGSLISQRPQEINKKVLNMSGTMFAFQMTAPQERKAVKDWIADAGVSVNIEAILQRLKVGAPHVERVQDGISKTITIAPRVTADLSSTPKVGASLAAAKRELTPIDLAEVETAMAATLQEIKSNDPKELKRKVAELTRQLAAKPVAAAPAAKPASLKPADLKRAERLAGKVARLQTDLAAALGPLTTAIGRLTAPPPAADARPALRHVGPADRIDSRPPATRTVLHFQGEQHELRPVQGDDQGEALPPGEQAVLHAAVQFGTVSRAQLGVTTGYRKSSLTAYVSRLSKRGYLAVNGKNVTATAAGGKALGTRVSPLPTGAALMEWWRGRLPKGELVVLNALMDAALADGAGADMPVAQINEKTGFAKSSVSAYLSRLGRRGLVTVKDGVAWPSENLFG